MMAPEQFAQNYAASLLRDVGCRETLVPTLAEHPAITWARSGLMDITGHAGGVALMCPAPIAACADGALLALAALTNVPALHGMRGAALLGQRARLLKLYRNGRTSPSGASRLLQTLDGWLALSLVRPEDWSSIPALLNGAPGETWHDIAAALRDMPTKRLLHRAHLLGLAASQADRTAPAEPWANITLATRSHATRRHRPVVIDLSTLWAGPLCGQLLQRAGGFVVKVESETRPDGARAGHGRFFDFLNAGKASAVFDFRSPGQIGTLRRMIERADIVIESARPRALRQLGLDAENLVAENPGLTWVSITGHGRHAPNEDRIGFGDDAAAGAGLCQAMLTAHGEMVFCGDAIADPLTGLHAAIVAWATWQQGGGMVALSLRGVVSHCLAAHRSENPADLASRWSRLAQNPPPLLTLPEAPEPARSMGADMRAVLADFALTC